MRSRRSTSGPSADTCVRPIPTGCSKKPTRVDPLPAARACGLAALAFLLFLSACGRIIPETRIPPIGAGTALGAGLQYGPPVTRLGLSGADAGAALASFRESCPKLLARDDASGLTRNGDWKPACDAARAWSSAGSQDFFARYFETARIGDGKAFVTGYYEPEIAGVRHRQPGFDVPVYGLPPDLVRARPGDAPPLASGRQPLGRYDANGQFVPYWERADIEDGALMGKGLEIAWAADPVEFFFLQVQGSGRLRAPDGSVMRIGYAGQSGQPYTGIGG
ncbi:MAG: MltA domain-containing protein, partial [Novosphingobium sp.]|nr:MltA domain-containing protein [Novosphingobium sp.]